MKVFFLASLILCLPLLALAQKSRKAFAYDYTIDDLPNGLCMVTDYLYTAGQSKKYIPVLKYDPKRVAAEDLQDAIEEAQRTNRRILLEVGGEWCSWCHTLDGFFDANPDLLALREKNFVTVKINFSEENENREVLSRYGAISGYPHMFVLDPDGRLLHSQDTGVLESGKSYDLERLTAFLTKWSPDLTKLDEAVLISP